MRAIPRAWPLALALLLGGCGGGGGGAGPVAPVAPGPLRIAVGTAPQRGPSDAWVTVIEFSDFQCPYCGAAEPGLKQLLADLPADARLLYRHYPLTSIHPDAYLAAVAAECAHAQGPAPDGDFWDMHDRIFAAQASWSPLTGAPATAAFTALAGQVAGLDTAAWSACLTTQPPADRIAADVAVGDTFVRGTPTFVVNGTAVLGATDLRGAVDAALAYARQQTTYTRAEYYDKAVLGL